MGKYSLRQRITNAFLLSTFLICTLFSVGVFVTVHSIEFGLFSRFFTEHARWLIRRHLEQPLEHEDLPDIESFFDVVDKNDESGLPPYLQNLEPGWHEITYRRIGLHVYVEDIGGHRYIVAHDQSEFEQREVVIGAALFAGVLGALGFAWWLSTSISGRIIKPLSKLSSAIENQDHIDTNEFAKDEVGNLAKTFVSYRHTLEDFLKRERFFTSDVSHELRTPLMSASLAIELLLMDEADDHRRETLERANTALIEMRNLVDTFLTLARQTNRSASTTVVSVAELVANEISKVRLQSPDCQVSIDVKRDFYIDCTPTLLSVVIGNLLRNAVHHSGQGAINLIVNTPFISVTDNGTGIAQALIDAVFHGDGREMPSLDVSVTKVEGNGLGLFIVKRVCDHNGWIISVESNPNGTTFFVQLPPFQAQPT